MSVGRPDVVESNPDEPTYTVTSELTLTVTRDDNDALITCAVDHPSIANGDKKTEQPLSVLCKTRVRETCQNARALYHLRWCDRCDPVLFVLQSVL